MIPKIGPKAVVLLFLGLMASCGDQSLFMPLNNTISDLQVNTVTDGQIITNGQGVPLTVAAQDASKAKDLEMEVTLTSPSGGSVYHNRQAVPALNEQLSVQPPSLPPGQYRMDVVIYSSGEVAQKKSANFFVASGGWRVAGIKSYPPVIASSGKVLLKADLQYPDGADPWLRWSWKGKVIQKGSLSQGLGKILWTVPAVEGVYTIMLEMFPVAPSPDSDYSFSSSVSLSTDVYVSTGSKTGSGDLGSPDSYLTLLRLQATLDDSGGGARKAGKTSASAIGSPELVSTENGFGYRLAGGAGFSLPWVTLPVDGGSLRPFTASFGITFDSFSAQNNLLVIATSDGSFTFTISVDGITHAPQAVFQAAGGQPVTIPWSGAGLVTGQRYLLSLSIIPQGQGITALWLVNGELQSSRTVTFAPPVIRQDGTTTIGGPNGFTGVLDEFGIYYRDEQGRASPDPAQYQRMAQLKYGQSLAFASGFEGIYVPTGMSTEGKAAMTAGTLTLSPDSALVLPDVKLGTGSASCTIDLSPDSSRIMVLRLQWGADSAGAVDVPQAADSGELKFKVAASGQSLVISGSAGEKTVTVPGASGSSSALVIRVVNPPTAHTPVILLRTLATRDKT
ncbi:MAG: hypothetical protein ABSG17_01890 [Spirochaetia bacterium]|jgi:hypothetical protein